jgi:ankyrin repeat protein
MVFARILAAALALAGAAALPNTPARSESENELSIAAAYGDAELVKDLIESGAAVNAVDEQGWTPLAYAAAEDNAATATALLEAGARPFAKALEDSPIVIAAAAGSRSILAPLLRYAPSLSRRPAATRRSWRRFRNSLVSRPVGCRR